MKGLDKKKGSRAMSKIGNGNRRKISRRRRRRRKNRREDVIGTKRPQTEKRRGTV
jgi:hypothetical protein